MLPVAPAKEGMKNTEEDPLEEERRKQREEHYHREFRIMLRHIIKELRKDKKFYYFWHPGKKMEAKPTY